MEHHRPRSARDRLLARLWAADSVYSDPEPTLAVGRAALSDAISEFQRHYPGARFRCSAPQTHHRVMRVSWMVLGPDGAQLTQELRPGIPSQPLASLDGVTVRFQASAFRTKIVLPLLGGSGCTDTASCGALTTRVRRRIGRRI